MLAVSYAMAENGFAVTQSPPGQGTRVEHVDGRALAEELVARPAPAGAPGSVARVSCGLPIGGTQVQVVDDRRRPLPERRVGEVAIRGDCLFSGYYRRPELEPFHDGWYLTGDRGYLAGGELTIVGRARDLIINAGKNIYPQDIETIVSAVEGVHPGRAAAFGVSDEREGTELIAVVAEVDEAGEEGRRRIAAAIRQAVARESMVTVSYVHLAPPKWLIKTSSGKVNRAANREKWRAETGQGKAAG
jgi:acyl-CoA synthetase (AMP-forming)/AMP-acid ligase II